jgi:glycogen(starch) synthase
MVDSQDLPASSGRHAVVHIGAWPPPIGGVTTYVRRLSLLLRDRGWRVTVLDTSGEPKAFPSGINGSVLDGSRVRQAVYIAWRLARIPRDTLVHIHVSVFGSVRFLFPLMPPLFRRRRVILSIYGGPFTDWARQLAPRRLESLRRVLVAAERVVVVSQEQREAVIDHIGVSGERVRLIPPFLLEREVEAAVLPDLPPGDAPLALASGMGEPLYWWEGLLDAVERLGPRLRWALTAYMTFVPSYFELVERRVAELPNVALFRDLDAPEFQSLLASCDLFVRPTLVDGDSITVREALTTGKLVVASDAVRRPAGVILFRSKNVDDLVRAIGEATDRPSVHEQGAVADFSEEILSVYAETIERARYL